MYVSTYVRLFHKYKCFYVLKVHNFWPSDVLYKLNWKCISKFGNNWWVLEKSTVVALKVRSCTTYLLCAMHCAEYVHGRFHHRVHRSRDEIGGVYLPSQPDCTLNFVRDGKCSERGWACTPHPDQPGLIFPSWWIGRQKAAVATLCVLCGVHSKISMHRMNKNKKI